MRLVCPHCTAAYDVPPALVVGRRAIRCARCGEEWAERGEAEKPEAPPPVRAVSAPVATPRVDPPIAPSRRSTTAIRLAWVVSVLVLVLAGWGAVAWRTEAMHAWPPSQRVYSALGLAGGR